MTSLQASCVAASLFALTSSAQASPRFQLSLAGGYAVGTDNDGSLGAVADAMASVNRTETVWLGLELSHADWSVYERSDMNDVCAWTSSDRSWTRGAQFLARFVRRWKRVAPYVQFQLGLGRTVRETDNVCTDYEGQLVRDSHVANGDWVVLYGASSGLDFVITPAIHVGPSLRLNTFTYSETTESGASIEDAYVVFALGASVTLSP